MSGTEGAWAPYVIAALSAGSQYMGAEQEAADKRDILNRSLERTDQASQKAATEVVKEGENYTPEQRALDMQAQQDATAAQSAKDLAAGGIVGSTASANGANSAEFQTAKAGSDSAEGNRISAIAQEMARVRAPGQLLTQEGLRRSELAGNLNSDWSTVRNFGRADGMDAESVGPSDLSTIGAIGGAIGQAYNSTPTTSAGTAGTATNYLNGDPDMNSLYTVPKAKPATTGRVFGR